MARTKEQNNQSLGRLVTELRTLNKFDINLKKIPIEQIIADPIKYGEDMAEDFIIQFIPQFLKAKALGKEFAKEVLKDD